MNRRNIYVILGAAVLLLLTGCFAAPVEEMYSLPELPATHNKLQELINAELASGSEYLAPTSGAYRQSVQLYDIDGDGVNEALAFFRGADQVPKICVYGRDGDKYSKKTTIGGKGASIGRVEYADLDGDGCSELIAAWQISSGLRILTAYSLRGLSSGVMLTVNCTDFHVTDIGEGNGAYDLIVLNVGGAEGNSAGLYVFDSEEPVLSSAKLSVCMSSVDRLRTGNLDDGGTALFIEGRDADSVRLVTDVLTVTEGKLRNITLDADSGDSVTQRNASDNSYAADIDGDRVLELPETVRLPSQTEGAPGYYVLDWYSLDSYGNKSFKTSTYHATDGWYLILTESWRESLTVRREDKVSGERVVVLSRMLDGGEVRDFLIIYTLTGDNRGDRAKQAGRFVLLDNETTVYAAKLLPYHYGRAVTEDEVISRFNIIRAEWMTGAV